MRKTLALFLAVFINAFITINIKAQNKTLSDYNIKWTTPGINSQGSMPLGNGDIGANVWVEKNGDLVFYVSKTDAWSEIGRLLKLGKVRVSLSPNPIKKESFMQELKLYEGQIIINCNNTRLKFWIDANHPVIHVDVESNPAYTKTLTSEANVMGLHSTFYLCIALCKADFSTVA